MVVGTQPLLELVVRAVRNEAPESLLLLAPTGHAMAGMLEQPHTHLQPAEIDAAAPARRYALAVVADALESQSAADATAVLAWLRDLAAQRLLVLLRGNGPLDRQNMIGLGFRVHAVHGDDTLYGFDLFDYKDRPDWLNPRFWAHPELWDKYRW